MNSRRRKITWAAAAVFAIVLLFPPKQGWPYPAHHGDTLGFHVSQSGEVWPTDWGRAAVVVAAAWALLGAAYAVSGGRPDPPAPGAASGPSAPPG